MPENGQDELTERPVRYNNQPVAQVRFRNRGTSRRNGTVDRSSVEFEGTMDEYLRLNPALRDVDMAERAEATPHWLIWIVGVVTLIIAVCLFLWVAWSFKSPTPTLIPAPVTIVVPVAPALPLCSAVKVGCEARNAALGTGVPAACANYVVGLRTSGGCM